MWVQLQVPKVPLSRQQDKTFKINRNMLMNLKKLMKAIINITNFGQIIH